MPEINGAKTQWNKQNIIRLALIAGIKYLYWGRKLLHMNSTISYCSKGCSPSVKVTICLGNFWSTRFCSSRFKLSHRFSWWEHALNAFPQGQEELVTIELSIHYAAINPVREWKNCNSKWMNWNFVWKLMTWPELIAYHMMDTHHKLTDCEPKVIW